MHAIILAAGNGTRLKPLTDNVPKPLIEVNSKPLLEHVIDALPNTISSLTIVIGYLGEQIRARYGETIGHRQVTYITQTNLNGTGGAIALAQPDIHGPTLVVNADDIYTAHDLERLSRQRLAILATKTRASVASPLKATWLRRWQGFTPASSGGKNVWQNCGAYVIDQRYFANKPISIPVRNQTELSLPHTLAKLAEQTPVYLVPATRWLPVGTPEELRAANNQLR
jgi:UDP-N-acetylglucosamine diphosphorylase / glucose-1-phosphate thymidylyltransferase / UDP-N-acetylgalactosamine diphosphorylase / glucosamine-1-phosphate N-acetyltransferase / galactosamine-1-phosphate N-acetyltransferase